MNLELCFLIVFKLHIVGGSGSEYVLDKNFLKNALSVVYNSKGNILRGKVFLSEMWPKISSLIPLSITQEHVEVIPNLCTEIEFRPKLNEITKINFEANLEGKEKYAVEAKLGFLGPVVFNINKGCSAEEKHSLQTVSLSISKSKINFSIVVPNFNHEKEDKVPTECIVVIDSMVIGELGKCSVEGQSKVLAEADIKEALSISIMVSLTEKLEPAEDENNSNMEVKPEPDRASICLSQTLNNKVFTFLGNSYDDQNTYENDAFPLMYEVKVIVNYGKKVSYAKINIFGRRKAIQICIKNSIESLLSEPDTIVKGDDFFFVEPTVISFEFPKQAAHTFKMELVFNSYAPLIYRHLRDFFGMDSRYFVKIFCEAPLRASSSAGNSGSTFYISQNKEIIAKTIDRTEIDHMNHLLPKYLLYMYKDGPSLLPKIYGVYTFYQPWKITNLMITNSVFPSDVLIHLKYDLKGSLFLRKAKRKSVSENLTYRDVDFREQHPKGIFLKPDHRKALLKIIKRDSIFLRKQGIMDYSLLLGIHFVGESKEGYRREDVIRGGEDENEDDDSNDDGDPTKDIKDEHGGEDDNDKDDDDVSMKDSLADDRHGDKTKVIKDESYFRDLLTAGIPARTADGKEIIIYVGIIDMLQTYKLDKKIVHYFLHLFAHPDKITLQNPRFYAWRFVRFLRNKVFKKLKLEKTTDIN